MSHAAVPPRRRWLLLVLVALFVLRAAAGWYAFDRLPLVSSFDEFPHNDVAEALAHGQGYRAPAYEGAEYFHGLYPVFPPLYIYVQAVVLRVLGLSAFSMRLVPITCSLVAIALVLAILWLLAERGWIDRAAAICMGLIALTDPVFVNLPRWGRGDPLALSLALAGFTALLVALRAPGRLTVWHMLAPSALVGLAMGTHWSYLVYYLCLLVAAMALGVARRVTWLGLLVAVGLPPAVFLALWIGTFGSRWIEAYLLFRQLARYQTYAGRGWGDTLVALRNAAPQEFVQGGGLATWLTWFAWAGLLLRGWLDCRGRAERGAAWTVIGGMLLAEFFVLEFMLGLHMPRIYAVLPISLIGAATVLAFARPAATRWVAAGAGVCVLLNVVQVGGYLAVAHREYLARDPERHVAVLRPYVRDPHIRVACEARFWYPLHRLGLFPRVIDLSSGLEREFWKQRPELLQQYDLLVLPANDTMLPYVDRSRFAGRRVADRMFDYYVFQKRPAESPPGEAKRGTPPVDRAP